MKCNMSRINLFRSNSCPCELSQKRTCSLLCLKYDSYCKENKFCCFTSENRFLLYSLLYWFHGDDTIVPLYYYSFSKLIPVLGLLRYSLKWLPLNWGIHMITTVYLASRRVLLSVVYYLFCFEFQRLTYSRILACNFVLVDFSGYSKYTGYVEMF